MKWPQLSWTNHTPNMPRLPPKGVPVTELHDFEWLLQVQGMQTEEAELPGGSLLYPGRHSSQLVPMNCGGHWQISFLISSCGWRQTGTSAKKHCYLRYTDNLCWSMLPSALPVLVQNGHLKALSTQRQSNSPLTFWAQPISKVSLSEKRNRKITFLRFQNMITVNLSENI